MQAGGGGESIRRGAAASPGIAIGRAYVVDRRRLRTPRRHVEAEDAELEIARFRAALRQSEEQLRRIQGKLAGRGAQEPARILEAHLLMLRDEHLVDETARRISEEGLCAEWALRRTVESIKEVFDAIEDDYFRERRSDIDFVGDRILRNLLGEEERSMAPPPDAVVVAHDLSPADTADLQRMAVAAFVTDAGGRTSHTAILARAHEIPAVVGLDDATAIIGTNDLVIVDGTEGLIIVNPEPQTVSAYRARARREAARGEALLSTRDLPAETLDGRRVRLLANIDFLDELNPAVEHGAEGVGLYRTEFLFLGRPGLPDEEEHFGHACSVLERAAGRLVTFRTFDLGGEKTCAQLAGPREANPALGLRSIRLCLSRTGLPAFRAQLRGLLRASVYGPLRIMFPMIGGVDELREARAVLDECKHELTAEGRPFVDVPVGVMIEMPAAALVADLLAAESDFFSIGTNDLIQYVLAVDRINEHVSYLYRPLHPALLRLIRSITDAARAQGTPVSMCGEMAGEPMLALVLVGLGIEEMSMSPSSIPLVKTVLRASTYAEARRLAEQVLALATPEDIEELVRRHMVKRFSDDVVVGAHLR